MNIGNWEAKGFEAALDVLVYDGFDTQVSLNGRYQWNETKLNKFSNDPDEEYGLSYLNTFRTGLPMPSMFQYTLLNGDEVGVLPEYSDTTEYQGPTYPPHEASLGLQTTFWNRLTLDAFFFAQWGHVLYDDLAQEIQRNYGHFWAPCQDVDEQVEAWFNEEPGASIADLTARQIGKCSRRYSDNQDWLSPGDFIRLSTISASYRMPESWLARMPGGFDQATLQFTVQNVAKWSKFRGLDPDALINTAAAIYRGGGYVMPPPRRFTLNMRLNF
jgi:hypothetical protein